MCVVFTRDPKSGAYYEVSKSLHLTLLFRKFQPGFPKKNSGLLDWRCPADGHQHVKVLGQAVSQKTTRHA